MQNTPRQRWQNKYWAPRWSHSKGYRWKKRDSLFAKELRLILLHFDSWAFRTRKRDQWGALRPLTTGFRELGCFCFVSAHVANIWPMSYNDHCFPNQRDVYDRLLREYIDRFRRAGNLNWANYGVSGIDQFLRLVAGPSHADRDRTENSILIFDM